MCIVLFTSGGGSCHTAPFSVPDANPCQTAHELLHGFLAVTMKTAHV
jgi:hypothetical protein